MSIKARVNVYVRHQWTFCIFQQEALSSECRFLSSIRGCLHFLQCQRGTELVSCTGLSKLAKIGITLPCFLAVVLSRGESMARGRAATITKTVKTEHLRI